MTPGGVTDATPMQRNSTGVGHDPLGGLEVAGSKVTGSVRGHRVGGHDPLGGGPYPSLYSWTHFRSVIN